MNKELTETILDIGTMTSKYEIPRSDIVCAILEPLRLNATGQIFNFLNKFDEKLKHYTTTSRTNKDFCLN